MSYVHGATLTPARLAAQEVTRWRTRAAVAEARAAELETARQAALDEAGRHARRVEALEREIATLRPQNQKLRDHNATLRNRNTPQTKLWPGDTPEICAARLEAAAAEAAPDDRALRTHCQRGHEFSEENTYRDSDGARVCRACKRAKERARYARRVALKAVA